MAGVMPKKVQVGPTSFGVVNEAAAMNQVQMDQGSCLHGIVRFATQTIHVNPNQGPDVQAETLLHELIHAHIWQTGLSSRFDGDSEEEFVRSLSPLLLDTLRRNPKLVAYLLGKS